MIERNADGPAEPRIELRMGINLGDIISDDDDIYGDGVNASTGGVGLSDRPAAGT
jgi:class 3 adenylate cyclase